MPVKLDKTGKCVVEPGGKVVKCHNTHDEALAHMRAINANTKKENAITETFSVEANADLMDCFKGFLSLLQYNTHVGHSSFVAISQDGDGADIFTVNSPDVRPSLPKASDGSRNFPIGDMEYVFDGKVRARMFRERALDFSEKSIDNTIRNLLESKIHQSFTVAADEIFGRGYMDRDMRIALSGLIGDLLGKFGESIDPRLANTIVDAYDADWVNSKEIKPRVLFFKDAGGLWRWLGIVSNNRLDLHGDIITAKGHRNFVSAIDSGRYKAEMGLDMPELWLWHVPFPIGDAQMIAFDERGFLIAAGKQRVGRLYDRVFEALAKVANTLGMSHSFPVMSTSFNEEDSSLIDDYMSREFTFLPLTKAANWLTGAAAIMFKELDKNMQIPEQKREWFIETFGEEDVAEMDKTLSDLEFAANTIQLPKKELEKMSEVIVDVKPGEADQQILKAVVEGAIAEVLEPETTGKEAPGEIPEIEVKAEEKAFPPKKEPEDEDEEDEEGKKKKGPKKEAEFVTAKQFETTMAELVKEVTDGVKEPFDHIMAHMKEQADTVAALSATVEKLQKEDEAKLAEMVSTTPMASIASSISKSIIGDDRARVDYKTERDLYKGPEETEAPMTGGLGIKELDKQIQGARNHRRTFSNALGQQS